MHAADLVVNHRTQRQPVEARIDTFPHNGTEFISEAMLALPEERPVAVVLLPAVDLRCVDGVISRRYRQPLIDASMACAARQSARQPLDAIDASMAWRPPR